MTHNKLYTSYLHKHSYNANVRISLPGFRPEVIVVIPSHDEGDISPVLRSLYNAHEYWTVNTMIIVVVNAHANNTESVFVRNGITVQAIQDFSALVSGVESLCVQSVVINDMNEKDAGVGLARKIGMDEAVRVLNHFGKDGIIACTDADSLCQSNYFEELMKAFRENPGWDAVSIHYEHPLEGYSQEIISAIIDYELHLRVFVAFQKWLSLPYAFHTIGSSMAVRASIYCKYGGMNKRKAGEDFYFLHKIGDKGKVGELSSTFIIPSPRISHRVPFGTGKAVGNAVKTNCQILTYSPGSFLLLAEFIRQLPQLYDEGWEYVSKHISIQLKDYLEQQGVKNAVSECFYYTRDYPAFKKRFFQWFNAFKLMKYCHYCRDVLGFYDVTPMEAFLELPNLSNTQPANSGMNPREALLKMRIWDKKGNSTILQS